MWNLKGRFNVAEEEDEEIRWIQAANGEHIAHLLAVSYGLKFILNYYEFTFFCRVLLIRHIQLLSVNPFHLQCLALFLECIMRRLHILLHILPHIILPHLLILRLVHQL